ncbi:MAG: type II toxin-antitoxin system VapC family toxin [Thiotrichaceae bacterium]
MIMLDTNICIYVLKQRPTSVLETFEAIKEIHISSIVYAELWSGIEKSPKKVKEERKEELLDFLSLITVQDWDESAGRKYAKIHTFLQKNGMMIGNMDLLIAAHASSLNATLVTNNIHEFERVNELRIENWV